jgi:hypothetical protein
VRGDRAIVDDPSALRILRLHGPDGGRGAQHGSGQVHRQGGIPVLQRNLVHAGRRAEHPGIVEQQVHPRPPLAGGLEKVLDVVGPGDVAGDRKGVRMAVRRLHQLLFAPPGEGNGIAVGQEKAGHGPADAGTRSGDHCDASRGLGMVQTLLLSGRRLPRKAVR